MAFGAHGRVAHRVRGHVNEGCVDTWCAVGHGFYKIRDLIVVDLVD